MVRTLALLGLLFAVTAMTLYVVTVVRAVIEQCQERRRERRLQAAERERRMQPEQRPSVIEGPDAWRQWAGYYRGLAEQARAEGNPESAATYRSLAASYHALTGDAP